MTTTKSDGEEDADRSLKAYGVLLWRHPGWSVLWLGEVRQEIFTRHACAGCPFLVHSHITSKASWATITWCSQTSSYIQISFSDILQFGELVQLCFDSIGGGQAWWWQGHLAQLSPHHQIHTIHFSFPHSWHIRWQVSRIAYIRAPFTIGRTLILISKWKNDDKAHG